jgi:hypothetical protein
VVIVEDLPELPIELDGDALAQFSGADHVVGGLQGRSAAQGLTDRGSFGMRRPF